MPAMRLALALPLAAILFASPADAGRAKQGLSPVTRVVGLLQGLQQKIEAEGKAEEELFNKFVCWAKSIISAKEATNADAGSRIDTLNTYISDLDTGRIELTTERQDLEKELEQVHADIELAEDVRNKEKQDFLSAKAEMEKAIAALTAAIDVLTTATKDHKDGVLLGLRGRLSSSLGSRAAEAATLSHAVELGRKFLTKGDSVFLQRLLSGEVPKPDWKKLNRAATFKKGYKARSFKIQSVLAKLLETFETNLAQAKKKESDAISTFTSLMSSKTNVKDTTQDALGKLEKEKGAAGLSKAESQDEVSQLSTQVTDDTKYIAQVKKALEDKRTEWDARKALRAGESEAISKAISILHSDDARDLFKQSFKSQAYSLFQQSEASTRRGSAIDAIRKAAYAARDSRLGALATRLANGGHFDAVLGSITTMIELLRTEETSDLMKKEKCESDRATDTRKASLDSRKIDEHTDAITALQATIKELAADIESKEQEVAQINQELAEATKLRQDETAAYEAARKDDLDARNLVVEATNVLETFYQSNGLMLAQRQPVASGAGEAPPPPPKTWEGPYGGRTQEATGIVAVLVMIKEDIMKDMETAQAEEGKAMALYTETKTAMETEMSDLNTLITSLNITKGEKESEVVNNKDDRRLTKGSLNAVMKKIAKANAGCVFFTVNFVVRSRNRQAEIDGLEKAFAILSGAKFTPPEDPNREIKPGDAFLQHWRQHRK